MGVKLQIIPPNAQQRSAPLFLIYDNVSQKLALGLTIASKIELHAFFQKYHTKLSHRNMQRNPLPYRINNETWNTFLKLVNNSQKVLKFI